MKASSRKCRWIRLILVTAVVFMAIGLAIPTLLSSGAARWFVLGLVNDNLSGGRLQIEDWSLSWSRRTLLIGIDYSDLQGLNAKIGSVEIQTGLLGLLRDKRELGAVTITRPWIEFVIPSQGDVDPAQDGSRSTESSADRRASPATRTADPSPPAVPTWDLSAVLSVRDGSLTMRGPSPAYALDLREVTIDATILGLAQPVEWKLHAVSEGKRQRISAEGVLEPPADRSFDIAKFRAAADVELVNIPMGPFMSLAALGPEIPRLDGVVGGQASVTWEGSAGYAARGTLAVDNFSAAGGILGGDRPSWKRVECAFEVEQSGASISLPRFTLDTGDIRVSVAGTLDSRVEDRFPGGGVRGSVIFDLASLSRKLPETLNLREGLEIRKAYLDLRASVDSSSRGRTFSCSADLRDVEALLEDRLIQSDSLAHLSSSGKIEDGRVSLDDLTVQSAFVNANGRGDLDRFRLTLSADLATAMDELRQFVKLEGIEASGRVSLDAEIVGAGEKRKNVSIELEGQQLLVAGLTPHPVRSPAFSLHATAIAEVTDAEGGGQLHNATLEFTSELLHATFFARRIDGLAGAALPGVDDFSLTVSGDLQRISEFAHRIGEMHTDLRLFGAALIKCSGGFRDGILSVDLDESIVREFRFAEGGSESLPQQLSVRGGLKAAMRSGRIELKEVDVRWGAGKIGIPDLVVVRDNGKIVELAGTLESSLDLANLVKMLGSFVTVAEGSTLSGVMVSKILIATTGDRRQVDLKTHVDDLRYASLNRPALEEQRVAFRARAFVDPAPGNVEIKSCIFESSLLALSGSGSYRDWRDGRRLTAAGKMAIDFERAGELVRHVSEMPLEIEGRTERPFSIDTSLRGNSWLSVLRETTASAGISLSRLSLYGVETGAIDVPLLVSNRVATVSVGTTVNDGRLQLDLRLDASDDPAFVSLPANSVLLSDVGLDSAMANGILARIHPVFLGSVVSTGRLSLVMKQMQISLDPTVENPVDLAGDATLHDVIFRPGALLQRILGLARFEADLATVPNQRLSFQYRDGALTCSPLLITVARHELVFQGGVAADGTLSYKVRVPLTRELVGDSAYKYLRGQFVTLPVSGTADHPRFDQAEFRNEVKRLIKGVVGNILLNEGLRLLQ